MPDTYYRNILGAAFNDEPLSFNSWKGVTYFIYGNEICPDTGRAHLQYYVEFRTQKRFRTIKKAYPQLHFESRDGTPLEAIDYCKKDGDWTEWGKQSQQGSRCDLADLRDEILSGNATVDDIMIRAPLTLHMYGRTLNAIEDYYLRRTHRTQMTQCTWFWGPTATGKSHRAYEGYSPETHYNYPYDGGWWDGYRAQTTVIINEFRGQIKYSELLNLVDKWPKTVRRRNRQPRPFMATMIYITSNAPPSRIYRHVDDEDSMSQLLRRITVIHMTTPHSVGSTV